MKWDKSQGLGIDGDLGRYFCPEEVLSPDGLLLFKRGVFPIRVDILNFLLSFRHELNKALLCNIPGHLHRGWRSPEENRRIYESARDRGHYSGPENPFSFHTAGVAFDLTCPELSVDELALEAEKFGWNGIGLYDTFVHLDKRDGLPARWSSRSGLV